MWRLFQFERSWETEGIDKEQSRTADVPGAKGQERTHKSCLTKYWKHDFSPEIWGLRAWYNKSKEKQKFLWGEIRIYKILRSELSTAL